jgi:hypothetical protein
MFFGSLFARPSPTTMIIYNSEVPSIHNQYFHGKKAELESHYRSDGCKSTLHCRWERYRTTLCQSLADLWYAFPMESHSSAIETNDDAHTASPDRGNPVQCWRSMSDSLWTQLLRNFAIDFWWFIWHTSECLCPLQWLPRWETLLEGRHRMAIPNFHYSGSVFRPNQTRLFFCLYQPTRTFIAFSFRQFDSLF